MRMPRFSAEASLYRRSDSHYNALESAVQTESGSVVAQLLPKLGVLPVTCNPSCLSKCFAGCLNIVKNTMLCLNECHMACGCKWFA